MRYNPVNRKSAPLVISVKIIRAPNLRYISTKGYVAQEVHHVRAPRLSRCMCAEENAYRKRTPTDP